MAKVLCLAPSGFGKSTSVGKNELIKIKGLDPKTTFIVSATSKPLPFKASGKIFPIGRPNEDDKARRFVTNDGDKMASVISYIIQNRPEITDIVIDDANYVMQDYYMANAQRKGFDVFKEIGIMMDRIFAAMELSHDVNFYMLAHYEEYKASTSDEISYRFKTVGKMVQDYITPEGKFDIVLFGDQSYNEQDKKVVKEYVTNFDGKYPAKSAPGMMPLRIPNDLGVVKKLITDYYG